MQGMIEISYPENSRTIRAYGPLLLQHACAHPKESSARMRVYRTVARATRYTYSTRCYMLLFVNNLNNFSKAPISLPCSESSGWTYGYVYMWRRLLLYACICYGKSVYDDTYRICITWSNSPWMHNARIVSACLQHAVRTIFCDHPLYISRSHPI